MKLTLPQLCALKLLDRGGFIRSVAGWHPPESSVGAFNGQTLVALELKGLVRFKRRSPHHRASAAFITADGRRALTATHHQRVTS